MKVFVSVVLERLNMIGVCGEIIVKYFFRLGFCEGIDYMVIGCFFMYVFGRELKIREIYIILDLMVMVNLLRLFFKYVLDFIMRSMKEFLNYYFIL